MSTALGSQQAYKVVLPAQEQPTLDRSDSAIERALQLFDRASNLAVSVISDSEHESLLSASRLWAVEKDIFGQVTSIRFESGEISHFLYNNQGQLSAFNYAGLDWRIDTQGFWLAKDNDTDYFMDGRIEVLPDGTLRIGKENVVRQIKISGEWLDEHAGGSCTEGRRRGRLSSPYDLLAVAKPANSKWLPAQESQSPLAVTSVLLFENESELTASTPARSRLRQLSDKLPESQNESFSWQILEKKCRQELVKCALWLLDRFQGQSSAEHLPWLDRLARIHFEKQQNDLAELTHLRALYIRERYYGEGCPESAVNHYGLACIHYRRCNQERAAELFKQAVKSYLKGLRKTAFLYSQEVLPASRLVNDVEALFDCLIGLHELSLLPGGYNNSHAELQAKCIDSLLNLTQKHADLEWLLARAAKDYADAVSAELGAAC